MSIPLRIATMARGNPPQPKGIGDFLTGLFVRILNRRGNPPQPKGIGDPGSQPVKWLIRISGETRLSRKALVTRHLVVLLCAKFRRGNPPQPKGIGDWKDDPDHNYDDPRGNPPQPKGIGDSSLRWLSHA